MFTNQKLRKQYISSLNVKDTARMEAAVGKMEGTAQFRCDNCGARFEAPNFPWFVPRVPSPQFCPECGSLHTLDSKAVLDYEIDHYKAIWKWIEDDMKA